MKILILHNAYQRAGGEDAVVAAESEMLRSAGHDVILEKVTNDAIQGAAAKARAFLNTPHDPARRQWAADMLKQTGAQIVHIHNFFPLMTPATHEGARAAGAAVVQTLHNYRLLCANAQFLREGSVCEKCVTSSRIWSVVHRCYRGSAAGSFALMRMQHRAEQHGTWNKHVDRFIALTQFAKGKFIEGGLPADRIAVKPNSVGDIAGRQEGVRSGALFVGRLSPEKGVDVLMKAWTKLADMQLTVLGDGPERERLQAMAPPNVTFKGAVPSDIVRQHMLQAEVLLMPSIWYEGFPMTAVEAFAASLPVVASRIGSLAEIVEPSTGALFQPGSPDDLAAKIRDLQTTGALAGLGQGARRAYEQKYAPQINLRQLEHIYAEALAARHAMAGASSVSAHRTPATA